MSTDFWAGWVSGLAGILIGNPLDILKVQLQAGREATTTPLSGANPAYSRLNSLVRGVPAPAIVYGTLNALLYVSYNQVLFKLDPVIDDPTNIPLTNLSKIWTAGAVGGLAIWAVSAPSELVKCQAQLGGDGTTSWSVARDTFRRRGLRGLYQGGTVTSIRDSIGYGFYFCAYELSKRSLACQESKNHANLKILLSGGIAGVVTWASVFPLDVIKTRLQSPDAFRIGGNPAAGDLLLQTDARRSVGTADVARQIYRQEGLSGFFRGFGVCSVRAFIVNAVQWAVYEWAMRALR